MISHYLATKQSASLRLCLYCAACETYHQAIVALRVFEVHLILDHESRARDTLSEAADTLQAETKLGARFFIHLARAWTVATAADVPAHVVVQGALAQCIRGAAIAEDTHEAALIAEAEAEAVIIMAHTRAYTHTRQNVRCQYIHLHLCQAHRNTRTPVGPADQEHVSFPFFRFQKAVCVICVHGHSLSGASQSPTAHVLL